VSQQLNVREHVEYAGANRLRERYGFRDGLLEGPALVYDDAGWLQQKTHYRAGRLNGEMILYGPAEEPLFSLPAQFQADFDQGRISPQARQAFAAQGMALLHDAQVVVEEEAFEWLISQAGQDLSVQRVGQQLNVHPGRRVQVARFEEDQVMYRAHYVGGRLEGESATYDKVEKLLTCLALTPQCQQALDQNDIQKLQLESEWTRQNLRDDAIVSVLVEDQEWLIAQPGQEYVVRKADGQLCILDPRPLFGLPLTCQSTLDQGDIQKLQLLFQQKDHPLADDVLVQVELAGKEWRLTQLDKMYAVRKTETQLEVHLGRIIVKTAFAGGALLSRNHYVDGQLDGLVTICGDAGEPLFDLDLACQSSLDAGDVASLRAAFQEKALNLSKETAITVEVEGSEWLIVQPPGLSYALEKVEQVEVCDKDDGSLFSLTLACQSSLDAGDITPLRSAFEEQGHALSYKDSTITVKVKGSEWWIRRSPLPPQFYKVKKEGEDKVKAYDEDDKELFELDAGLVSSFDEGNSVPLRAALLEKKLKLSNEDATIIVKVEGEFRFKQEPTDFYKVKKVKEQMNVYGEAGGLLFALDSGPESSLDAGDITPLRPKFEDNGHGLSGVAEIIVEAQGRRWSIVQPPGQSYTVKRVAEQLKVYPGRVVEHINYQQGQRTGKTTLYDAGQAAQLVSFEAGKLHGPTTTYMDGKRQTVVNYVAGVQGGQTTSYDKDERQSAIAFYKAGKLDGEVTLYEEGQKKAVVNYKDNQQHGFTITYHANGKKSLVSNYMQGVLDGDYFLYYDTGRTFQESACVAGKLEGELFEYYPQVSMKKQASFEHDKPTSVKEYDQQGNLVKECTYKDGELETITSYEYDEKGKLKSKITCDKDGNKI
jgi:antitoxin component YwqK of YwqJK toxin-antitoxin module